MARSDGSITFSTDLDNSKLEKELNELTKQIKDKEKSLTKIQEQEAEAAKKREKARTV